MLSKNESSMLSESAWLPNGAATAVAAKLGLFEELPNGMGTKPDCCSVLSSSCSISKAVAIGSTAVGMVLLVATQAGGGDSSALLRGLAAAAAGAVPMAVSGCFCTCTPLLEESVGVDNVGKGSMAAADGSCCGSSAAAVESDGPEAGTPGGATSTAAKKSSASLLACDDDPKMAKGLLPEGQPLVSVGGATPGGLAAAL
ncbi:MAG: hypothetical protein FRX49_07821 [Trebouxia sp. A1-2]|nr:MAG: hypothetical protein FRX49_07821 [Trebouxia sp. A1-2]